MWRSFSRGTAYRAEGRSSVFDGPKHFRYINYVCSSTNSGDSREGSMAAKKSVVVSLRMSPKLKAAVDHAAKRSGLGLMDWCRMTLGAGADQWNFGPPKRRKRHGKKPG
jgi:hypothetical protein